MVAAYRYPLSSISPEEYLAQETVAQEKHEYYDGEIIPMAGASINHNYIVGNLYFLLRVALKGKEFIPFTTDLRLWVPLRNAYTYPDVVVVAGTPQCYLDRSDTITNPIMLIEVLSETTSRYDRGDEFVVARSIPTLRDYLIVDQARCLVEQFTRVDEHKWLFTEYHDMEQVVELSFDTSLHLALRDVYERVDFPPATGYQQTDDREGDEQVEGRKG
jgi:Uma2 family endonuclease